jgi:hypothetical protein
MKLAGRPFLISMSTLFRGGRLSTIAANQSWGGRLIGLNRATGYSLDGSIGGLAGAN